MITDKIKALFQYIDFLHSNIDNFSQYEGVVQELHELDVQRKELQPEKNFIQKKKFDEIQQLISEKFELIREGVLLPVKNKAIELNVCDFRQEPIYSWYGVESDIRKLKESFSENDLNEIFTAKNKYIEFRKKTVSSMKFTGFFVGELDEVSKLIFDFFKETEQNEFEAFETKTIQVGSIQEAAKVLSSQYKRKEYKELPIHENDFEAQNKTIFAISQNRAKFYLGKGKIQIKYHTTKGTYDLQNLTVYDSETGKIVEIATQGDYNSLFTIQLHDIYILDVKPYLKHHFENSIDQRKFFEYVKYGTLHNTMIKHEGIKKAIQDWINENEGTAEKLPPTKICINENRTKRIIQEAFESMDNKGWEYAFLDEQDFNLFTDLLTNFFEYENYELPEKPIQLKKNCKTKLAKALGEIHRSLSNEDKLNNDLKFFELIMILSCFKTENQHDLYKALTR